MTLILRDYQGREGALGAVEKGLAAGCRRQLVSLPTGCHRRGQGILLFDGRVVRVEDVRVGDQLMGPDSRPRRVLALARGEEEMVQIRPVSGSPWVVNRSHVLSLVRTAEKAVPRFQSQRRAGEIVDVPLPEWGTWSRWRKHIHKLFRVGVEFPAGQPLPFNPYWLGLLLGDGTLWRPGRVSFTTVDEELLEEAGRIAAAHGLRLRKDRITYHFSGTKKKRNPLAAALAEMGLSGIACRDRFIPDHFRLASRRDRLAVLAGLLDTDGHQRDGGFEFSSMSERLAADVAFVARSLGLAAFVGLAAAGSYRVSISGDCSVIPCRVARKRAPARRQKKDVLRTGFSVQPLGVVEKFFGFTLDGDGRYLLDDFTVTHNTGKTVLFANLPAIGLRRLLVVAHREELLDQAADKLRHWNPGLTVQVDQADRWADVETLSAFDGELFASTGYAVCASVATIGRAGGRRLTRYPTGLFDAVILDECFPAGTLVDGKPIESVKVGDVVWCRTGAGGFTRRPVTRRFVRSAPLRLIRLHAGGRSVVCTPNHPILTQRGWITAALVTCADMVLCFSHAHRDDLHGMHEAGGHHGEGEDGHVQEVRPGVLLDDLSGRLGEPEPLEAHGGDEQEARLEADARKESDARPDRESSDENVTPGARLEAAGAPRERSGADGSPTAPRLCARLADGGRGPDRAEERVGVSDRAEGGHRERRAEDRDRGGRELSPSSGEARGGRPKGCSSSWARVDSLEVLEPGSDGTFGGLCPNGLVYNLEVEEHHTYVANGVVVHNCHHATAQSYQSVIDHFGAGKPGGPLLLGVTATPFRADGADLSKVFEKVVYSLELPDAIVRGYLVDIRALAVATGVNLDAVGATREDFKVGELAEAVNTPERNGRIVKAFLDHAADRKGIVFAADVQHSKDLAEAFEAAGVASRHVDGTTPGDERAATFAWMREPGPRVLCNVGVATEGYDEPSISVVLLARPTKSRVLYSQMIGRGTRLCPGKVDLLVIDLADVSSKHTLVGAAALFGLPTGLDLAGKSATKARARVQELVQEGLPFEELAKAKTLADLETIANEYKKVSLFWQPKTAPEVTGISALSWVSVGDGAIALRAGELRAWIATDMLGHAHLALRRRPVPAPGGLQLPETLELAADFPTLEKAVGAADALITAEMPKVFTDPKARWRKDPASEKQVALLKKFRVPFREPITKGEAGILLDKVFARRGAVRRSA